MNSPWGLMWNAQKETGWTDEYLLWGISWVNVRMKLADAPYYSYSKSDEKSIESEEELEEFVGE